MTVSLMKTPAETAYTDAFDPQGVLAEVRKTAFAQFAETGLPHRRLEDWKWTDLRQLISKALPPVTGTTASADIIDGLIAASPFGDVVRARLVFVDGVHDAARSALPATGDVEFVNLGADDLPDWLSDKLVAGSTDPIAALNLAYMSDGAGY